MISLSPRPFFALPYYRLYWGQKAHATGKIPRTKDRREGQPTDDEVLVARAVDRVLRPLFPIGYCFDTQVDARLLVGGDVPCLRVLVHASSPRLRS